MKLRDLTIEDDEVVFAERGKARGLVLPDKEHDWVFAIVLCISSRDFVSRCSIRFRDHKPELRIADNPKAFPVADGRVIALYVMPEAGLSRPGSEQARLDGRQIVVGELVGFRGAFWQSGDLAFALIADLPRGNLLDLARRLIHAV